ncbi:unnamed protein product [Lactuca virosa]|uniref:Uncharacterized protein n=1 Tax=Lactuca virosa TaxID=75947 RepID=A0AAU9NSA8_9ASTR|nr:unnamed protein product [Lactuca virosa]
MAEIAVTAVITVLCEKLLSGDLMKEAGSIRRDRFLAEQMEENLTPDPSHDVLDDLAIEALRRKLNQEAHTSTSTGKVLKFFPNCCTNFTPRNFMYGRKMSSKLDEITAKLRDLVDQKNDLGLNVNVERSNIRERQLEQTSLVDESKSWVGKGIKRP